MYTLPPRRHEPIEPHASYRSPGRWRHWLLPLLCLYAFAGLMWLVLAPCFT